MIKGIGLERFLQDIRHRRDRYRQFIGIMFIFLVTAAGQPFYPAFAAGSIFVFLGIAVRMWASGHIKKNRVLATDGPYAYVRHPLYVGNILLGVGFSLASGLWWSIVLFVAILWLFYPQAIRHEDEKLHRLFGEDWRNWRRNTRALIPKLRVEGGAGGDWSFYQSLRQNGEPIIALILLICLYFLHVNL
jgi:protein-S-isoprenylcysteine O-methyltransferase Ste14